MQIAEKSLGMYQNKHLEYCIASLQWWTDYYRPPRPGRKMSAVVGWVNVKDLSIPHLKALTVTFKLM